MIQLEYKNRTLKFEHWEELSQGEFLELFRRINAPWFSIDGRLELSKWLYMNQCSVKFLIKKFVIANPIKILWWRISRHTKFYGPAEGFRNMTMGEFLFADVYYFTYLRDQNKEDLNKFIASIFREKKPWYKKANKDLRREFDETLITVRANVLKNLTTETKQAIVFNYGAVRKDITNGLKFLFPKTKNNVILNEAKNLKPNTIQIPQWDKWMWKLAEGNTDEDFDKVANSLCRNILKKIDSLIEESKKKK